MNSEETREDRDADGVVVNVHVRDLAATIERCGSLIDGLASDEDRLWPRRHWPAMRLAPGLSTTSPGGHGPVRYYVKELEPGKRVRLSFTGPAGFDGYHEFRLEARGTEETRIVHTCRFRPRHVARLTWPLVFRPLHDALIEDAHDGAAAALAGQQPPSPRWSRRVRLLRGLARGVCGGDWPGGVDQSVGRVHGGIVDPEAIRDRLSVDAAYADRFVLFTDALFSPREWARATFEEGMRRRDRDFIFERLLGLRTGPDGGTDSVAGWEVVTEDREHILLHARGSGIRDNLLVECGPGWVALTTALEFSSTVRAGVWRLLCAVHRREAAPALRTGEHLLACAGGRPDRTSS